MKSALIAFIVISVPVQLSAAGRNSFGFLLLTPGARSAALGESYAALAEGSESVSANPSGLGFEERAQVTFHHLNYVEGILFHSLAYLRPMGKGAWCVQAGYLGVGGIQRTVADPTAADGFRETGEFSTYDMLASFSFGRTMTRNFAVGGTLRLARESLGDTSANGFAADGGFIYGRKSDPLRVGLALQHLGPKVKFSGESFDLPRLARLGVALRNSEGIALRWAPRNVLLTGDVVRYFSDGELVAGGGVEWPFFDDRIKLRSGYHYFLRKPKLASKLNLPNGFSFGLGFTSFRGEFESWSMDYALVSGGDLGFVHRVSISLWFGASR